MVSLRTALEHAQVFMLCNASRPDVWPSGMSVSMGGGLKAYVTRVGSPATDLLHILDEAPPESVGTVAEQRAFHARWVESWMSK